VVVLGKADETFHVVFPFSQVDQPAVVSDFDRSRVPTFGNGREQNLHTPYDTDAAEALSCLVLGPMLGDRDVGKFTMLLDFVATGSNVGLDLEAGDHRSSTW